MKAKGLDFEVGIKNYLAINNNVKISLEIDMKGY